MITVTPSNVPYLSCLRKAHELMVMKRFPGLKETSPALRFGNVLHAVMRHVYDPNRGTPPHIQYLDTYIRAALLEQPYEDEESKRHDAKRAERLVRLYADDDEDSEATVSVEQGGTFPILVGGETVYYIRARPDRILIRPEQNDVVVCRDYKTSNRCPSPEQIFINLAVCKGLYPGYRAYRLEQDAITDEGVQRTIFTSAEVRGVVRLLSEKVRRFTCATEFPAEPADGCAYCQAKAGCPAFEAQAGLDSDDLDQF